jgi:hypothetical protein
MHWVIDIIAAIILLFFLLAGWHRGLLLSVLSIVRTILAYGVAFLAGRYIGFWLGGIANRPRIVTIPVIAGLTFVLIAFAFHVVMTNIRDTHREKEEKEDFTLPKWSCLGGSIINLASGLFSAIFIFWLGSIFSVGVSGNAIPGSADSHFAQFAQRSVYEVANVMISREGKESQAAAMARVVSNPEKGMNHLETVLSAETVQALLNDKEFAIAMINGDQEQIEANESLKNLMNDRDTLLELKELGLLSGREKKSALYESLSKFGGNENIQVAMESLKAKGLLSTDKDKILLLIRDPDFDIIVGEVLK